MNLLVHLIFGWGRSLVWCWQRNYDERVRAINRLSFSISEKPKFFQISLTDWTCMSINS